MALLYSIVSFAGIEQQFLRLGIIGKDSVTLMQQDVDFSNQLESTSPLWLLVAFFLNSKTLFGIADLECLLAFFSIAYSVKLHPNL